MPELERAVRLAIRMRAEQRRFFASQPGSDERKDALSRSRQLERDFDRLTRLWGDRLPIDKGLW